MSNVRHINRNRVRGALPGPVVWLRDCLEDGAAVVDDDQLNDEATLELFDQALSDGVIDIDEALKIRAHLALDRELTNISASLNFHGNRACGQVVTYVNNLRALKCREAAEAAPQLPAA